MHSSARSRKIGSMEQTQTKPGVFDQIAKEHQKYSDDYIDGALELARATEKRAKEWREILEAEKARRKIAAGPE